MTASFTPRHCQKLMQQFALLHNRCNIWATPGTGKTSASFMLLEILRLLGSSFFPALVIAPKQVAVDVWTRERAKWHEWRDLRVVSLAGLKNAKARSAALKQPADIYVINYELVEWLCEQFPEGTWPFKCVIADESTKLRNFRLRHGGKRSTALARIAKHVGRWVNLTGTPRPKSLIDLWGQMWFVDRGERLGRTFGEFSRHWFDQDPYTFQYVPKPNAFEEITAKIADVTLTIEAGDYFDLPPIVETVHEVDFSDETMRVWHAMDRDGYVKIGNVEIDTDNAAAKAIKKMQISAGGIYTEPNGEAYIALDDAKLDKLEAILDAADGPVLTAYHWKFDFERIMKRFPKTREIKTPKSIDAWNAGKIDHGIIHPASAGHGIDLAVGGNTLVFIDQWWDLETFLQVIERLGPTRQAQHGLNRPLFLHLIVARGTDDGRCVARRDQRRDEQKATMERMKKDAVHQST